jgi:hypothetical protein
MMASRKAAQPPNLRDRHSFSGMKHFPPVSLSTIWYWPGKVFHWIGRHEADLVSTVALQVAMVFGQRTLRVAAIGAHDRRTSLDCQAV